MEVEVCLLSDLKEKTPFICEIGERTLDVFLIHGHVYAYENTCPHFGGPVCLGGVFGKISLELDEDKRNVKEVMSEEHFNLVCPWHGFELDLEAGVCVFDEAFNLDQYPVVIKDNAVLIQIG